MGLKASADSHGITSLQFLAEAAHSLRFELTFGICLLLFWCFGKLVALGQKTNPKDKLCSSYDAPNRSKKATSPRNVEKDTPQPALKGWRRVLDSASPPTPVAQLGLIDQISAVQLCDPSWLVPQVVFMCQAQVQQSLVLYRTALEAGLNLHDLTEKDCQQLFVALVTAAIRTGHVEDAKQLLRDLRRLGPGVPISLFCSVAKLCTSKHLFMECLALYDFMCEDSRFMLTDKTIWSCLLFSAIEVHVYDRCSFFFGKLKEYGEPSQKDYGNMIRLAALQADWKLALQLVQVARDNGITIDSVMYNTALGICVSASQINQARGLLDQMEQTQGLADVITYNTLMKGYARAGCMEDCCEVFHLLKQRDINPSQVTYGILLDGFINQNQLERAAQVFSDMSKEGYTMNTVLYTTLIKGFARAGEVDQAMKVFDQMHKEHNVTPDLITFSILIKANCDAERLTEALELFESMINLNLRPDEVVFNSLLAGCARAANAKLGKRVYSDMVSSGVRPSNATFSILIRFYLQCKLLEEAVEMLRTEPAKHKVDPEPRIFVQLIQSCIRERQGRRAVEVYEMLAKHSVPSASTHRSILATCMKLNMFDTAGEILAVVASNGGNVQSHDANSILDGALRKRKFQAAQDIATSLENIGVTMDPSLLSTLSKAR